MDVNDVKNIFVYFLILIVGLKTKSKYNVHGMYNNFHNKN